MFETAITIKSIEHDVEVNKKAGGTFKATKLIYTTEDGKEQTKLLPKAGLKFTEGLEASLHDAQAGDKAVLKLEKKGAYWNVVGLKVGGTVTVKEKSSFKSSGGSSSYSNDNAIGMQVGNAISNATLLVAHKVTTDDLETTARKILVLGDKLKAELKTGKVSVAKVEVKKEESTSSVANPFGDL